MLIDSIMLIESGKKEGTSTIVALVRYKTHEASWGPRLGMYVREILSQGGRQVATFFISYQKEKKECLVNFFRIWSKYIKYIKYLGMLLQYILIYI